MKQTSRNKNRIRACRWLLEVMKKRKTITFKEISELWKQEEHLSGGLDMVDKTFQRYKDFLKETFGIIIVNKNRGDYVYYISNPEILRKNNISEWMLNTLAVDEKMKECISLSKRIRLEPIPSGGAKLDIVTDAMLGNVKLQFMYQKYGSPERKEMEPGVCGLILYNQRWYILGEFDDKSRYTFALDRMWEPKLSNQSFEIDPTFDVNAYFSEFYGIYNSGRELTNIVIRAFGDEAYYMRDLPIHESQKEIGSTLDYTDFMICVRPNNELIGYLLSRKNRLKVLSPNNFKEELKNAAGAIMKLYDLDEDH